MWFDIHKQENSCPHHNMLWLHFHVAIDRNATNDASFQAVKQKRILVKEKENHVKSTSTVHIYLFIATGVTKDTWCLGYSQAHCIKYNTSNQTYNKACS